MKGLHYQVPSPLPDGWVRPEGSGAGSGPSVEVFDEHDGSWLIRSSFNRDRVLRLTRGEVMGLAAIALFGKTEPAPEIVGAEVGHGVSG